MENCRLIVPFLSVSKSKKTCVKLSTHVFVLDLFFNPMENFSFFWHEFIPHFQNKAIFQGGLWKNSNPEPMIESLAIYKQMSYHR